MTFDERIAELGVETRDFVPGEEHCKRLYDRFFAEAKRICEKMSIELDGPFMVSLLLAAVAKRDTIINRMETRIVNLTGERDYLITQIENDCTICANADPKNHRVCAKYDICPDECFEFEGVPEDWSVDND